MSTYSLVIICISKEPISCQPDRYWSSRFIFSSVLPPLDAKKNSVCSIFAAASFFPSTPASSYLAQAEAGSSAERQTAKQHWAPVGSPSRSPCKVKSCGVRLLSWKRGAIFHLQLRGCLNGKLKVGGGTTGATYFPQDFWCLRHTYFLNSLQTLQRTGPDPELM